MTFEELKGLSYGNQTVPVNADQLEFDWYGFITKPNGQVNIPLTRHFASRKIANNGVGNEANEDSSICHTSDSDQEDLSISVDGSECSEGDDSSVDGKEETEESEDKEDDEDEEDEDAEDEESSENEVCYILESRFEQNQSYFKSLCSIF